MRWCRRRTKGRTPVSEQNTAEAQETSHIIFQAADHGARKAVSEAKISSIRRTLSASQDAQDDWCAGQNVVPEQAHQVEVMPTFYRAMLCIRGTSHGPLSVCLSVSVTCQSCTKTAKRRITQTTPHDSPGNVVFWSQRSPRNSTGMTPYEGAKCRWSGSKSATRKRYKIHRRMFSVKLE